MDEHPVLREMQRLGCGNSAQVDLAFQTYISLCERDALWNVSHRYCAELDVIVLTARRSRDDEHEEVFLPVAVSAELTPAWLRELPRVLGHEHVTLALVEAGTVVLHELRPGMHPMSPSRRRKPPDPAVMLAEVVRQHVLPECDEL